MVTMKVIGTLVDEKPKESSTFTNLEWNPPVIIKKKTKNKDTFQSIFLSRNVMNL